LLPGGQIDFALADKLWPNPNGNGPAAGGRRGRTRTAAHGRGHVPARSVSEAHLAALRAERLRFELERVRGEWRLASEVRASARAEGQRVRDALAILPSQVGHRLHLVDAREAQALLADEMNRILLLLSDLGGVKHDSRS